MTAPPLETDDILLRQVSLSDAPAMQTHFANWEVIRWIGGIPWPYPDGGAREYITRRREDARHKEIYFWAFFSGNSPPS